MSAVALLLKEAGWIVTGSDAECYGPPKETLARAQITCTLGYNAHNIPEDATCFVIGRNAKLNAQDNEEVRAAVESGKTIYSFPEILGMLTKGRHNVVVAGSYGKSTTTALLAHIARAAGVDAGYFIGAEPLSLAAPASLGTAPTFILEGDEYPSSHTDSRAKFMHLHPTDVILTSVVHDHVNVYPTMQTYEQPFKELLTLLPESGIAIVSAEEPNALRIAKESGKAVISYGVDTGTYHAAQVHYGEETSFDLMKDGAKLATLTTTLLGRHNVEDIVAASVYALERNLVSVETLPGAIRTFTGVRRRLDRIAPTSKLPVYEGFGSSYEKAHSAIVAMRLHFPGRNLVVIFEPHTFGWRNRANLSWYDDVFAGAEEVFVAPPETQGAGTHEQLSHDEILERIKASGIQTHAYDPKKPEETVALLSGESVLLILTSGDLEGSLPKLVGLLEERFSH